ncbi:MAG: Eco57I restriction-modification methylase domain-containing protein, partial [Promethearchaeota archaeon]
MNDYDLEWLKRRGFFQNVSNILIDNKNILIDKKNNFAYSEISKIENFGKLRDKLFSINIKYIWFNFTDIDKLKIYRKKGHLIKQFYYSKNIKYNLKNKIRKLNNFSPKNMDIIFESLDIMDQFYWQLWDQRIIMAKSIKKLKNNKNKLLIAQYVIDRLIFLYFLSQLGIIKIKINEKIWILDNKEAKIFFDFLCWRINEEDIQNFFNRLFFEILGEKNKKGWGKLEFNINNVNFSIIAPYLNCSVFFEKELEGILEREIEIKGIRELILNILNKYDWAIKDVDVESDNSLGVLLPEVIGYIYEKFVVSLDKMNFDKIQMDNILNMKYELKNWRRNIGAFYTPEKIINYIVKTAIYQYIKNKLKIKFTDDINIEHFIENFIEKKDFNKKEIQIVKYIYFKILKKIRICDNACGSGSFLIICGEILFNLYKKAIEILRKYLSHDIEAKNVLDEINKSINENYYISKQILLNNIYGIDIMEGAINIAKFRLWLWLISHLNLKNFDNKIFEILPILDFNLMVGNSLIGFIDINNKNTEFKGLIYSWINIDKLKLIDNLAIKRKDLRTLSLEELTILKDIIEKETYNARTFLNNLYHQWLNSIGIRISKKELLQIKPFHWSLEFPEIFDLKKSDDEKGFGIIIGNPPYGNILSDNEKKILQKLKFKVIKTDLQGKGTKNSAAIFIERSKQILEKNGIFGNIVPKSLLYIEEWEKVRLFLLNNVNLLRVVDCSRAFRDVKLEMCIIIYENQNINKNKKIIVHNLFLNNLSKFNTNPYLVSKKYLSTERFIIEIDKNKEKMVDRIFNNSIKLGEICKIWRGLNLNRFVLNKHSDNTIPILRGEDINRYYIVKNSYIHKKYLDNEDFSPGTLIFQRIVSHINNPYPHIKLTGSLNYNNLINVNTITNISIKNEYKNQISDKFLLVILNSKFINWFTYKYIFINAIRSMDFVGKYAESIPIIKNCFDKKLQDPFTILSDYMHFLNSIETIKNNNKNLIDFIDNMIIDPLIYEIYFKEIFTKDKIYQEYSKNLLFLILKDLKPINFDKYSYYFQKLNLDDISDENVINNIKYIENE